MTKKPTTFDYTHSLRELEAATAKLESGNLELHEAIEEFEKASQLAEKLEDYLLSAELKVQNIAQKFDKSPLK